MPKLVLTSNTAFKQMPGNLNHNLIFEKRNYKELADKILNFISLDAEETERMGRTLRNLATRDHSVESLMEKLADIIKICH